MDLTVSLDVDALARHRLNRGHRTKGLRPVNFRADADGTPLAVSLPGPDWLAARLSLDGLAAYRRGAGLLARPHGGDVEPDPVDLTEVVDALVEALRGLPARPDAQEPYADLRLASAFPGPAFAAYLADVVRAYVRGLPAVPRRAVTGQDARPAPKTALERKHAERARRRMEERASARWALACFLAEEAPAMGTRVPGTLVFDYVCELLDNVVEVFTDTVTSPDPRGPLYAMTREERLAEWEEIRLDEWESPPPARPRPVSRRVLFEAAERVGAFRITRPKGSVALTVVRRIFRRLQEATVNVLTHVSEVLGYGPRTAEEAEAYADQAVREVLDRAPATRPDVYDPRVVALPYQVAGAVADVPDEEVVATFGRMARFHLERHPEDRPAVAALALALRAGDPEGLVDQIRGRCADEILAEEQST